MINVKILLLSILALIFLILGFVYSPWFMAGAVAIVLINQRELLKSSNKNK